jgi:hypothetical protein
MRLSTGPIRTPCRVLAVVIAEDAVEVRRVFLQCKGTVEELLGCHGEELGLILRAVGVEEGFMTLLCEAAQPQEFVRAYGHPFSHLVTVGQRRGAVGSSVEHVELVSELVVYNVMSLLWVARPMKHSVPHEDHRTLAEGLAQDGDGDRQRAVHLLEYTGPMPGRHYRGGVNEDRLHVAIVIMGESKLQQTCLGGYSDPDLVGQLEAAAPLPLLLIQEYLYHRLQLRSLGVVEKTVVGHVLAHEGLPLWRERVLSHLGAAMVADPMEHGRHPLTTVL